MIDDVVIDVKFSDDKVRYAKILSNEIVYPSKFKVVMIDLIKNSEMFKFTRNLDEAQADAAEYVMSN
jgi:hypothetical protein